MCQCGSTVFHAPQRRCTWTCFHLQTSTCIDFNSYLVDIKWALLSSSLWIFVGMVMVLNLIVFFYKIPEFVNESPSWFPCVVMWGCWIRFIRVEDDTTEAGGKGAKVKVWGRPFEPVLTKPLLETELCGARATDRMLLDEEPPETWNHKK